ncbi:MAG: Ig-like domain-containing protein, partial [Propionibacteriaceae bacterium]|nr:Ig-like domain-containing protein [Propionibacteriaceae bacterium]
ASFSHTTQQQVTGIALTGEDSSAYGTSITLKAATTPANASNKKVTWSWNDGSLSSSKYPGFKITSAGKLTIPKQTATSRTTIEVRATAADKYGQAQNFTIALTNTPTAVAITNPQTELALGKSVTLKATTTPANIPNKKVTWAVVSGQPCGVINPSSGKFTASTQEMCYNVTVNVRATTQVGNKFVTLGVKMYSGMISKITLPATKVTLFTTGANQTFDLKGPGFAITRTKSSASQNLSFSSSNTAVATVSAAGLITALAPGTAKVKAAAIDGSGKSATVTVTVKEPVTGVSVSAPAIAGTAPATPKLAPKASLTPVATVTPSTATSKALTWEFVSPANATSLASLNAKTGKLTAKAVSTDTNVVIRAKSAQNPSFSATLTVTITRAASVIGFPANVANKTIDFFTAPGEAYSAHPSTQTHAATRSVATTGVVYSSSNTAVATVSAIGQVTALKPGTATITATAADYSGKKASYKARVLVPASSITITPKVASNDYPAPDNPTKPIALGKTGAFTAKTGSAFGSPSVTKVAWSIEADPASVVSATFNSTYKKYVSVNSSGVVSIKNHALPNTAGYTFRLKASATDGSTVSGSYIVKVVQSNGAIVFDKASFDVDEYGFYIDFKVRFADPANAHYDFTVTTDGGKSSVLPIDVYIYEYSYGDGPSRKYSAYFDVADTPGTAKKKQTFSLTVTCNASGAKATVKFKTWVKDDLINVDF